MESANTIRQSIHERLECNRMPLKTFCHLSTSRIHTFKVINCLLSQSRYVLVLSMNPTVGQAN